MTDPQRSPKDAGNGLPAAAVLTAAGATFCIALTWLALQMRAGDDPVIGTGAPAPAERPRQVIVRRIIVRRIVEEAAPAAGQDGGGAVSTGAAAGGGSPPAASAPSAAAPATPTPAPAPAPVTRGS